ncbi:hypothetical protein ILUMI_24343 [Ignelater luminosus]|uniref:Caspase-3 n=1 Tax=Ignelater luminosus TaxID=2038154 RepID=A0A8K0CCS0_IGNLU|nr:hypothetical protein ILUMI_24343 [Ignelater luminosus]
MSLTVSDAKNFRPEPPTVSVDSVEVDVFSPPKNADLDKIREALIEIKKKFIEDPEKVPDNREYVRSGTDPGLVVIFNQQQFESVDYSKRTGTNRDVNELILTFGRLGYNVEDKYIFNDLKRKEIIDELEKLANADHTNSNSLIIAVLTHGDSGNELRAWDASIYTEEIWNYFTAERCPTLKDKPKFFIFQACKGQSFSQHDAIEVEIIPNKIYTTPMESDMLVAFAAVEGSQSYRHIYNGTWFIQEMCRNFSAFGRRDDVVSLLIRTTKCVATNYYHISENPALYAPKVKKQMPLLVSTLSKNFYLNKSKDRNLMLHLLQQQDKIIKTLEEVKKKVNIMYEDFEARKKGRKTIIGKAFS